MNKLMRVRTDAGSQWVYDVDGRTVALTEGLDELLGLDLETMRRRCTAAADEVVVTGAVLAPIESQDVWGAGVTYQRSREGRHAESEHSAIYDKVYTAERPELFFKAAGPWVVAPGGPIAVRHDSEFDAPEPEIALVVNAHGEIAGYTIANDVTSRGIEGENPLYLPQAKIFTDSCALGPVIVPAWELDRTPEFEIRLTVERDGRTVLDDKTSSAAMSRGFTDLVNWLFRSMEFPRGVVLMTGTGIVPEPDFTLQEGDRVDIRMEPVGLLSNVVCRLGTRGSR